MLSSADHSLVCEPDSPAEAAPSLASEQGRRLNLLLWMLLTLTNFVDVLGTARAFEIGIGELNPIVEILHTAYGVAGIATPKILFLTMLFFLLPWVRSWTRVLFAVACSAYLALTIVHIWYLSPLL